MRVSKEILLLILASQCGFILHGCGGSSNDEKNKAVDDKAGDAKAKKGKGDDKDNSPEQGALGDVSSNSKKDDEG